MIKVRHMAQVCREVLGTPWERLSDRQRRMSTFIVNVILANHDATPRSCHNAWMGEMIHNEGFKHGDVPDETLKTHPNLVEYDALSDQTCHTYSLSIAIVRALQAIEDRYENCVPSESTRRPSEQPAVGFNTPVAPSDAHFSGSDPAAQTGPSETIDQPTGEVHFTAHNLVAEPVVDQVIDQVVEPVAEPVAEPVVDSSLVVTPDQQATASPVEQAVEQAVESIDPPAETDPARAE